MVAVEDVQLEAPDALLIRRRWVKIGNVEWAEQANEIMVEHGCVFGTGIYKNRHQARWRARKLISLLEQLGLQERWDLREHVNRRGDGWAWSVEYDPRREN